MDVHENHVVNGCMTISYFFNIQLSHTNMVTVQVFEVEVAVVQPSVGF
jgi:hypothetical protein